MSYPHSWSMHRALALPTVIVGALALTACGVEFSGNADDPDASTVNSGDADAGSGLGTPDGPRVIGSSDGAAYLPVDGGDSAADATTSEPTDAGGVVTPDAGAPPKHDAGGIPTADASAPPSRDAGAPPPDAGVVRRVVCGPRASSLSCDPTSESCCATTVTGGFTYACITRGSTCSGLPIACAEAADCTGGTACCYDPTAGRARVACMAASACAQGQMLCNPDPGATPCPAGLHCTPYGSGVPYYACR
jgi:hypothetical protein